MKDRIKQIRKSIGKTQVEFGKLIGVKGNTVTGYEAGTRTPSDAVITSICREFNVREEWLRSGTGEMFVEMDKEAQLMQWAGRVLRDESDSFQRRFVSMLSSLEESDWKTLEKMALQLYKKEKD